MLLALGMLTGCKTKSDQDPTIASLIEESDRIIDVSDDGNPVIPGLDIDLLRINEEDFEGHEYMLTEGDKIKYIYTVKNNSDMTVKVNGLLTLSGTDGNDQDTLRSSIEILSPGEESIMVFSFGASQAKGRIGFRAEYDPFPYENPVIKNLDVGMITNPDASKEKLSAIVTNKGESYAKFVEMHVLYFSAETLIGAEKKYLPTLKPGASCAVSFQTEKEFDQVKYYMTGYSTVEVPRVTEPAPESDFAVKQYEYKGADRRKYYLVVKNNGAQTARVTGIMAAYNARGYLIGARSHINGDVVLRPGDESVLEFDFPADFAIDHVDHKLSFDTDISSEDAFGQGELDVEKKIDGNMATITLTNRSYSWPVNLFMATLFLDRSGNVVWTEDTNVTNLNSLYSVGYFSGVPLAGGAAVTQQVYSPVPFDSVEVYYCASEWALKTEAGTPKTIAVRDDEFETSGYLTRTKEGAEYFCLVKNNSETTVAVNGLAFALDASGQVLGVIKADDQNLDEYEDEYLYSMGSALPVYYEGEDYDEKAETSIVALHPGETGVLRFSFRGLDAGKIDRVVCPLRYDTSEKDNPAYTTIRVEEVMRVGDALTAKVVNEAANECRDGVLYALFFDQDQNLIAFDRRKFTDHIILMDENGEIIGGDKWLELSSGAATTARFTCPEDYDHVEFYARSNAYTLEDGNDPYVTPAEGNLTVKEYPGAENSKGSLYTLVIRNHLDRPVNVNAVVTAFDPDDKPIAIDSTILSMIGPDEENALYFNFETVGHIDHVAYELRYRVYTNVRSAGEELTIEENILPDGVEITATNHGILRMSRAIARVLFLDAEGRVVHIAEESLKDKDANYFEPGDTRTRNIKCPTAFDKALIFYECYQ